MRYFLTTTGKPKPKLYMPQSNYFQAWPKCYSRINGEQYGQHNFSSPCSINFGDQVVFAAAKSFFSELGISEEDIYIESLFHMSKKPYLMREKRVYVVFGPGQITSSATFRPPSDPFTCLLFFGVALLEGTWEILGNDNFFITLMKKNEPIGCRDFGTVNFLRSLGIKAFFAGCFSVLFPRRIQEPSTPHTFGIDLYDKVKECMPEELLKNLTETSNTPHFDKNPPHEYIFQLAFDRYKILREQATLVVTRKIHIAIPCAAMGIPVVFIHDNINDSRVSIIKSILPFYHTNSLDKVTWQPGPSKKVEEEKRRFKMMFKCRLQQTEEQAGFKTRRLPDEEYREAESMIEEACNATIDESIHHFEEYSRRDFMKLLFEEHLEAVLAGERKVVFFGVGWAGKRVGLMLKYCGFDNFCFCDSKVGDNEKSSWNGIPVISIKTLKEQYRESLVVIASKTYFSEIEGMLLEKGFKSGQILKRLSVIDKYATFHVPYAPVTLYFGV